MAALPVMKLGTLLLRTLSKPIANRLKSQAAVHPKFGDFVISIAQLRTCQCSHLRMSTDAHLYDDPEVAAILALLDSRFDAHL
ncbi:hypothetical protein ZWY2020_003769 [Hordeum vulgare]|nr:hypothetical protein ZWY2020_003769 [Hordeum vulgare]